MCGRFSLSLFIVAALLAPVMQAQSSAGARVEKAFPANGRISMRLEAGAYQIRPSADPVIRVTWKSDSYEGKDKVKATVEVEGTTARIRVQDTPHNNFNATIEVPRQSDLFIRLTAGDLIVGDISGNKDIESRAGDLIIEVPEPNEYRSVDASSWAGDLNASAFQVSKGGLFRSFEWHGPGQFKLHAHLLAGDLVLRRAPKTRSSAMF